MSVQKWIIGSVVLLVSLLFLWGLPKFSPYSLIFPINFTIATNRIEKVFPKIHQISSNDLFAAHIEKCPECFLFLLTNGNSSDEENLLKLLNTISAQSKVIFYPLTMKLMYNQAIRFYTLSAENPVALIQSRRRYWIDRLKNYEKPIESSSILASLRRSLEKPVPISSIPSWPNQTKLILYYTKFFGNTYWYNSDETSVYQNDLNPQHCPISVNACRVSIDRKDFPQSDAALVHLRESINFRQLKTLPRKDHQRMVFFLKESPMHSPIFNAEEHASIFNYTQTYRPDSDITATTSKTFFWFFDRKIHSNIDYQSILKRKGKGQIVAALISNCAGSSDRLKYIKEMQKYIPVDVYGRCGKACPKSIDCRKYLYENYKFYLAFENSLCDEYVTEKFFYALDSARIIPVVLGWAQYNAYVPSSGYIDVRNFASPQALAMHLITLDRNDSAYIEHFRWRDYALTIKPPKYICELCLKLFFDDYNGNRQSRTDIDRYWNRQRQCHSYKTSPNGTWWMQ